MCALSLRGLLKKTHAFNVVVIDAMMMLLLLMMVMMMTMTTFTLKIPCPLPEICNADLDLPEVYWVSGRRPSDTRRCVPITWP